ncbi:major royal jelly protein 1-like [Anthonomus grandis grandis]|uniref:major royal jelly protein 1-like n=1 Tax=Anthonomus grandis grandis TaxID=2921223 RepID=UPI002166993A|nr:major royal jelly protein 1-like [Anthonomus grandis grandis]
MEWNRFFLVFGNFPVFKEIQYKMVVLAKSLLLSALMVTAALASYCDKNLIREMSFKLRGNQLTFPCESTRNIYTTSGRYIPKNLIATRFQFYKNIAFVALPRYRPGVPFTVAILNLKENAPNPHLEPFPSWSFQEEGNCESIQNAIDLVLDAFGNIWILDLGICNTLQQPVRRCEPKIWGFNIKSGELMKSISVAPYLTDESRLQYLTIDYSNTGVPFAFIADAGTGSIVVVNISNSSGYCFVLPPTVFTTTKDILYIQLARKPLGNVLYFTFLSSPKMFSIKSKHIMTGQSIEAIEDIGLKADNAKMILLGTDNGLGIFFRYKGESDIYIWNSDSSFNRENFKLVQKGGDCRMATQVTPGWKQLMWVIESNFHDYINDCTGSLGPSMVIYPLVKTSY